jgi:GNAT superfamily N-acetyltransferase
MMVEVRRARFSDYPAIAVFIREAAGDFAPFKGAERWRWQFADNPYRVPSDCNAPIWIAEDAGRIVGQIAVQDGSLEIDGETHFAGWIVDVVILPSHRGYGLGHRLYAAVAAELPLLVTLTMAPATRRMAERLGAVNLGAVREYSRWLHVDPDTVRRYLLFRTVHHPRINASMRWLCRYCCLNHAVARLMNAMLATRDLLVPIPGLRGTTKITEADRFGPEIDSLWQRAKHDFRVAFSRTSKFLNWRFCDCPQMTYVRFVAWRHGSAVGYLVLREATPVELPYGVIVDLFASRRDEEAITDMLFFALQWFGNRVARVQCATSIPEFATVLRRFGFHPSRTVRPVCVVRDSTMRLRLERLSSDWLFSKADHDWDQIYVASN